MRLIGTFLITVLIIMSALFLKTAIDVIYLSVGVAVWQVILAATLFCVLWCFVSLAWVGFE